MRFHAIYQRDAANAYIQALLSAGFTQASFKDADFILCDKEPTDLDARDKFVKDVGDRKIFFFPHTPYAYWLWDGKLKPMPVSCNFVVGEGAKLGMKAYGYPNRVEVCGFPRCEVKPFAPTTGGNLLYAPPRLMGKGWWYHPGEKEAHLQVMRWIIENRRYFDKVTVNYSVSKELSCVAEFERHDVNLVNIGDFQRLGAHTAQNSFKGADLVIACKTFGYLAVASGIPAILYGYEEGETYRSDHYNLYKSHYEFPLKLHEMTIDEVLDVRKNQNLAVELWKQINIGKQFDANRFISVVKEYIK
jgi:hypothetical protein